jgi:hypothetical protein
MKIYALVIFITIAGVLYSQKNGNNFLEIATWSLVQAVPSPSFYQDNNNDNSRLQFGLKWNITPVNYSFNANKMITPLQFFKVNPMRRYGGSIELFIQPEWTTSAYKYSDLSRFSVSPGLRMFIPFIEYGEYLAGSISVKYSVRKNKLNEYKNVFGFEFGTYILFGIVGLNYTYNFTDNSRYNFSVNFKYY